LAAYLVLTKACLSVEQLVVKKVASLVVSRAASWAVKWVGKRAALKAD